MLWGRGLHCGDGALRRDMPLGWGYGRGGALGSEGRGRV